jgi:twinkle protein
MTIYEDGLHCFVCEQSYKFKGSESPEDYLDGERPQKKMSTPLKERQAYYVALKDRGITKDVAKFYGVKVELDSNKQITHHIYPYCDSEGTPVFNKVRQVAGKKFFCEGDNSKAMLFGQNKFTPSDKISVTITEGELDALSVYQLQGCKFPAVSVRSSSEAVKNCQNEEVYRWLSGFKNIIVCFDNDKPGQKAAKAVALPL